jgi:hypothetical protein
MERHASWFQLIAVILVVVGLVGLAAPEPAHAMDPQLILALASAAGAIALIVGYLVVSNSREKHRAGSMEGIYTCAEREANGPMGCGRGPRPDGSSSAAIVAEVPQAPMAADPRFTARADALLAIAQAQACPGGQAAGPMGCGAAEPSYSATPASSAPAVQGQ